MRRGPENHRFLRLEGARSDPRAGLDLRQRPEWWVPGAGIFAAPRNPPSCPRFSAKTPVNSFNILYNFIMYLYCILHAVQYPTHMETKPPLLDPRRCAWIGPDDQAETHNDQCSRPHDPGKPYCGHHARIAFRGLPRAGVDLDLDPWKAA